MSGFTQIGKSAFAHSGEEFSVSESRKLPHRSISPKMAEFTMSEDEDTVQKYGDHVLTPGHDDTVANHFGTLTVRLAELAVLRYLHAGDALPVVLDTLSESALAAANYFRLVTVDNNNQVQYEWRESVFSVRPSPRRINATDPLTLHMALMAALISGNGEQLSYLSGIPSNTYVYGDAPDLSALRAMVMQSLCRQDERQNDELLDVLRNNIAPGQRLDTKLFHAECVAMLSLAGADTSELLTSVEEHLSVHKKLYDNDRRDMRWSILGLVSMPTLAIMILAQQRGISIDVANDYVPLDLLTASLDRQSSIV